MTERRQPEKRPVKLVLPLPANVANRRMHWRVKQRKKKAYWNELTNRLYARLIPKPPPEAPPVCRISVKLYVGNWMDQDNAMARLKWMLDWLAAYDYIADDNPKALKWDGMPEQEIDRSNPRVELTLEAIP